MRSSSGFCIVIVIVLFSFLLSAESAADIITVRQDGTGDYILIYDAVAGSSDGDTIQVWPGTYQEQSITITHDITLVSTFGADTTILDGQGTVLIMMITDYNTDCVIEGFRFTNGYSNSPTGGGLNIQSYATAIVRNCRFDNHTRVSMVVRQDGESTVEDCIFENNYYAGAGAAIRLGDWGSQCEVYNSTFSNNIAGSKGGAIFVYNYGDLHVVGCDFLANRANSSDAPYGGGAIYIQSSYVDIEECLFRNNYSAFGAGAIRFQHKTCNIIRNTFHSNSGSAVQIALNDGVVSRNIFTNSDYYGLDITPDDEHSCNVYWNNGSGPINGDTLSVDEVVADPLYCDETNWDYTISTASPAAPASSPCGLIIGGRAMGCIPGPDPAIVVRTDGLTYQISEGDSAQGVAWFGNAGGSALNWQVDPSHPAWLNTEPTAGTTQPGYTDTLTVEANATALSAGTYQDSIIVSSNDPLTPTVSIVVDLTVIPGPNIAVSDTALTFTDLYVGSSDEDSFYIYNVGGTTLDGTATIADPNYILSTPSFSILPGDSVIETITFQPVSGGIHTPIVTLISDDIEGDTLEVALEGRAIDHADLIVVPDSIQKVATSNGYSQGAITITNPGDATAPVAVQVIFSPDTFVTTMAPHGMRPSASDPPCEPWASAAAQKQEDTERAHNVSQGSFTKIIRSAANPPETEFFDDFETGALVGWQYGGSTGIKEVTRESAANGTNLSYRETNSSGGHRSGIYWELGSIQPQAISFWMRSGSAETFDSYFTLLDSQMREVIFFFTSWDGVFYVNANVGGHDTYPYQADVWYHIEFNDIDFIAKSFDYYVDDSLIQADIPFRNAGVVTDFGRLDLYNYHAGTTGWWDEIRISPGPPNNWLTCSPWSNVIPPGQSRNYYVITDGADLVEGEYTAKIIARADIPDQILLIDTVYVTLTIDTTLTHVHDPQLFPSRYALKQNYPNPFNPVTTIQYELPEASKVRLTIFNVKGEAVRTLEERTLPAGCYSARWDGQNNSGQSVASGIYFYRLRTKYFNQTRKMVLIK